MSCGLYLENYSNYVCYVVLCVNENKPTKRKSSNAQSSFLRRLLGRKYAHFALVISMLILLYVFGFGLCRTQIVLHIADENKKQVKLTLSCFLCWNFDSFSTMSQWAEYYIHAKFVIMTNQKSHILTTKYYRTSGVLFTYAPKAPFRNLLAGLVATNR